MRVRVLVVGDVMLDRYWGCELQDGVLRVRSMTDAAGGAANVAANVVGAGGEAYVVGAVGPDQDAVTLEDMLLRARVRPALITDPNRCTTVKTRLQVQGQSFFRVDHEDREPITGVVQESLLYRALDVLPHVQALVLEDYDKGILHEATIPPLIQAARARNIPTIVDPKRVHGTLFAGATVFKPNALEYVRMGQPSREDLGVDALVITHGDQGLEVVTAAGSQRIPGHAVQAQDTTGAGDTVAAWLAVHLARGWPIHRAAEAANRAAAEAVQSPGTTIVTVTTYV